MATMKDTTVLKKYGRKKKRSTKKSFTCQEPYRKSLYDVLIENMQLLQRNVFVHRLIYFGSHSFPPGELDNIATYFRQNIERINTQYHEEYLTGFLLYYTRIFIHMIEGSEEAIKDHLNLLYKTSDCAQNLQVVKVLVVYHNINQRFLGSWIEIGAKPPHLLHKIRADLDVTEARKKMQMCLTKIYKFAYMLRTTEEEPDDSEASQHRKLQSSFFEIPDDVYANPTRSAIPSLSLSKALESSALLTNARMSSSIPEQQLMEFLIETPFTMDIKKYMEHYGEVPLLMTFIDYSWPVETDYIPHNVYDEEYDPVTDLAICVPESADALL